MIAFASSLDQCGPLTRDVTDAALLLGVMQGRDACDSTSVGIEGGVELPSREDLSGLRFGVPRELVGRGLRGSRPACARSSSAPWSGSRSSAARSPRPQLPARPARDLRLLRARPGRVLGEPGALRRRPLRACAPRRADLTSMYESTRARGLRGRGQAADHARDLRALLRLLRRLLRERPEGPHPDRRGLRRGLRELRLRARSDLAQRRLRARLADRRPARDVPLRLLHRADVARRASPRSRSRPAWPSPTAAAPSCPVGFQIAGPAFSETKLLDAAYALERAIAFDARPGGAVG